MKSGIQQFRIKTVKGPFEPWYVGVVEVKSNRVLDKEWLCPHCDMPFKTRKACTAHCKGKQGQFPPFCKETKKGGKCYSGCTHE